MVTVIYIMSWLHDVCQSNSVHLHCIFLSVHSSFHPLSRSTLAYFHSSGLEEFTDVKGNPLPVVTTPTDPTSIPSDALQNGPYRIGVQLLGFIV